MYNETLGELKLAALRVVEGRGTAEDAVEVASTVLHLMAQFPILSTEEGPNGWATFTEEMLGAHSWLLTRTLPDGRVALLSMGTKSSPSMAQYCNVINRANDAEEELRFIGESVERMHKMLS